MRPQQPTQTVPADMRESDAAPVLADATDSCPRCLKPAALCVCEGVTPIDNNVGLLVLQHPQEQDRLLGTARLATLNLTNSAFRIGLSWPSLAKALGRPANPAEWAILHLGSAKSSDLPKDRELVVLDKKGVAIPDQDRALVGVKGIVIFDGTWSQAKTLWWRNAWVLKAKRLVLNPRRSSLYAELRREPRREGLSTIEAAALTLSRIEQRPEIETVLRASFVRMLARYRSAQSQGLLGDRGAHSNEGSAASISEAQKRPKKRWGMRRRRSAASTP